jgi:SAM-dependent methyltransferase
VDVVLSQLGLQFVEDRGAALREMHRVLAPGGRLVLNVAGKIQPLFAKAEPLFAKHMGPPAAGFIGAVFSMHDPGELQRLLEAAGFQNVEVSTIDCTFRLPPPAEFLWQYVMSTPLAMVAAELDDAQRAAFEKDVVAAWSKFADGDGMKLVQPNVVATATR